MRSAITMRRRSCRSRSPACRSCRCFISAPRWGASAPFWDQPRRIRRHQSAGGEARGGRLARARARQPHHRADAPAWRDGGRQQAARARVPLRSIRPRTPSTSSPRTCSAHVSPLTPRRSRDGGEIHLAPGTAGARLEYWVRRLRRTGRARQIGPIACAPREAAARKASPGADDGRQSKRGESEEETKRRRERSDEHFQHRLALALLALAAGRRACRRTR